MLLPLYFLWNEWVRWFWGLTCDFAGVLREIFLRMIEPKRQRCGMFTRLALCAVISIGAFIPFVRAEVAPGQEKVSDRPQQFEVASIRKDPRPFMPSDIPLSADDAFPPHGAVLSEHGTLAGYLIFAYKITDAIQYPLLEAQLPGWAKDEWFSIRATVEGNPTKDELRVLMQNLLIERFGLKVHREIRQMPVYALVLDVPGKVGPQLKSHPDDGLCSGLAEKKTSPERSGYRRRTVEQCSGTTKI
jgi:hypothetical protein